ncbi:phytoene/squalene synthase family protein [Microlunatus sp. Gsoil 973]|uniref:phytoene/squalene synthase family protein n=1 Tax=Microlunatus sp. Gsoil 973 TaxID=2672569 RepID=UPI0012B46EB7|nr:phytoene/squalene synthase family protein [Microlunatus sp. Gsoil 973]QGN34335.1 phytoene/squalene synthase family protein [Microlunatus sp. Gsoil 973]
MTELLRAGYRECARLTRRHGTTYYWGAAILPRDQRRDVHAVYGLCRLADDIVDVADLAPGARAAELEGFRTRFLAAVHGTTADPVLAAVADTVRRRGIDLDCFDRFFGAMAMDLTNDSYPTWDDLCDYMEGSAAVIGEMMLPILEPTSPEARGPARALGRAFQLTNFLRDVDEDLDRGRVYLPQEDLHRFGVDPGQRRVTPAWRALMAYEIGRNRELYAEAWPGIAMLPPASARCVGTALMLYARILDRIEDRDYDVFSGRARVPTAIKAVTAARVLVAGPPTPARTRTVRPKEAA